MFSIGLVHFKKFNIEIFTKSSVTLIEIKNLRQYHNINAQVLVTQYEKNCSGPNIEVKGQTRVIVPCIEDNITRKWPHFELASFIRDSDMKEKVRLLT